VSEREQLEQKLELKYLNTYVVYQTIGKKLFYGKVDRIAVEVDGEEFVVVVKIGKMQFKMDEDYLNENLVKL
jgi:hypothetical protein